jgi:hypothetical protein
MTFICFIGEVWSFLFLRPQCDDILFFCDAVPPFFPHTHENSNFDHAALTMKPETMEA